MLLFFFRRKSGNLTTLSPTRANIRYQQGTLRAEMSLDFLELIGQASASAQFLFFFATRGHKDSPKLPKKSLTTRFQPIEMQGIGVN